MNKSDKAFMSHFSMILGLLAIGTLAIIFLARGIANSNPNTHKPAKTDDQAKRIAPVGAVSTGDVASIQVATAKPAAAFDGTLDGAVIYQNVCFACHSTGALGAPKLVAAAWTKRIAQGEDTLALHAIMGYQGLNGYMPPKGGNSGLSDEQVTAAVQHMLSQLQ